MFMFVFDGGGESQIFSKITIIIIIILTAQKYNNLIYKSYEYRYRTPIISA